MSGSLIMPLTVIIVLLTPYENMSSSVVATRLGANKRLDTKKPLPSCSSLEKYKSSANELTGKPKFWATSHSNF